MKLLPSNTGTSYSSPFPLFYRPLKYRHTDMQTCSHADMQTYSHADIQTYRHADIQTCRHTDMQTYRHADIQTCRHADIQTYRHTDMQTYRHADIQTYRHTDMQTWIHQLQHKYSRMMPSTPRKQDTSSVLLNPFQDAAHVHNGKDPYVTVHYCPHCSMYTESFAGVLPWPSAMQHSATITVHFAQCTLYIRRLYVMSTSHLYRGNQFSQALCPQQ